MGKNSSFKIDDFLIDTQQPQNSKTQFSLKNGLFRTISGEIGKIHPKGFKLKTKTSSIGIRGTDFIINDTPNGTEVLVTKGEVVLATPDGVEVSIPQGMKSQTKEGETTPQTPTKTTQKDLQRVGANEMSNETTTNPAPKQEKEESKEQKQEKEEAKEETQETKQEKKETQGEVKEEQQENTKEETPQNSQENENTNNESSTKEETNTPEESTNDKQQATQQETTNSETKTTNSSIVQPSQTENQVPAESTSNDLQPIVTNTIETPPLDLLTQEIGDIIEETTKTVEEQEEITQIVEETTQSVEEQEEITQIVEETTQSVEEVIENIDVVDLSPSTSDIDKIDFDALSTKELGSDTYMHFYETDSMVKLSHFTNGEDATQFTDISNLTPTINIPTANTATYSGDIFAKVNGVSSTGDIQLNFDFANQSSGLDGKITITQGNWIANINSGTISNSGFSSTDIESATTSSIQNINGELDGKFYGKNADVVGGTLNLQSGSNSANGIFGGIKQ
jgi:hypothetical protein